MINPPEKNKIDYILINPSLLSSSYAHHPYEMLKIPGFVGAKHLQPYLVHAKDLSQQEYDDLILEAIKRGDVAAFIKSDKSPKELSTGLTLNITQQRAHPDFIEKQHYHFWFISSSILSYLVPVLSKKQKSALFNPVTEWHYFDHNWTHAWQLWENPNKEDDAYLVDLTQKQWLLVDAISNAIHTKPYLDDMISDYQNKVGQTFFKKLQKINNPKDYLATIAKLEATYPLYPPAGKSQFTQIFNDFIEDEDKTAHTYQTMNQENMWDEQAQWDYISYSNKIFERKQS